MIFRILIDIPHVVNLLSGENVPDRENPRHHGVVLIVVLMHSISAEDMKGLIVSLEICFYQFDVGFIRVVVNWIGLLLADYTAVNDIARVSQTYLRQFCSCQPNKLFVRRRPDTIAFKTEIL